MTTKRQVVPTAEAAEILGVSTATVRRMHARGELKGFLGKSLGRITVASIEELLGEPIRWPEDEGDPHPDPAHGPPKSCTVHGHYDALKSFCPLCHTPTETPDD